MGKRKAEREVSAGGIVFRRFGDHSLRFLLIRDSYDNWGFPKGHLEGEESPSEAALRETSEETGLKDLVLHGPIRIIDWHFRFRGRFIHKYCHFFLFESPDGEPAPQLKLIDVSVRTSTEFVKSMLSKYSPRMPAPLLATKLACDRAGITRPETAVTFLTASR